ncbi:acetate--CoA ligase [Candidatus Magnetominusculus dajiuhuensis]|uniref:acetate--CoA ligase n=1 Tax=Candidatus Magnetominusculus dajiuhuensis TaxID=3137712 RepID=UPI003B4360CC
MQGTGNIDVLMDENRLFPPPKEFSEKAHIKTMEQYTKIYERSVNDPEGFWAEMAEKNLHWYKKWDKVLDYDFNKPYIKWFEGGKLNASYNCLDRFVKTSARNKAAIIWESNSGATNKTYTYQQLYYEVNRFANVLKKHGIKKGDRVTIYLPMLPETVISLLACARIGAIHSVVFGGFSAQALKERIQDCCSKLVITADYSARGNKLVPLKSNADEAVLHCPSVEKMIVVREYSAASAMVETVSGRDFWWHDEINAPDIKSYCEPEWMDAEDPLFILYTSGSTGKPKGVLHTTGGYMLYTNCTFKWIFDYRDEDVFFCTADIGWITGHSYIVYGPLSNGATAIVFEGIPTYPNPGRLWNIVEKHGVNIFYTAPTAIRALMKEGDHWVKQHDLSSLRLIASVGEPINPEAWMWYYNVVGGGKLPIADTWWQTETGGILITPLPGAMTLKPGSACRPFPGIVPVVLKEDGSPAGANEGGYLTIKKPWPGILRGTYGDPENKRIKEVYFSRFPGVYFSGDGARCDEDGDYWLMGRIDDVINISGHRLGTAEVESALVSHESVAEAAVVGFPHNIKGEGLYVYVTLKEGFTQSDDLKKRLIDHVRAVIGAIATPDKLQFSPALPKTRSGKIMRRILRNIAKGDVDNLGDTSTLADPLVVDDLVNGRQ